MQQAKPLQWGVGTSGTGKQTTNQVIWASNGTGMSTSMNSSSHKDETATGDSTDGELDNGDQYMKFRWALANHIHTTELEYQK